MKRSFKYIVVFALIAALMLAVCACGSKGVSSPVPSEGAKTYEITGTAQLEKINDTTLRLHCTTNIAAGTTIVFSIDSYDGEQYAKKVVSMIDGENIYADFEIDPKWSVPISGSVSFTPSDDGKQPTEIQEMYGSKLENLTGDLVLYNSKGNFVCIKSEELTDY